MYTKSMNYFLKDFGKQLKNNHLKMRRHFSPFNTNCYRVYDRNIGNLPLTVDIYDTFVHITDYREDLSGYDTGEEDIIDTASRMLYFKKEQIIYKTRRTRKGTDQHKKLAESGELLEVSENSLKFLVNLSDYVDTGLFLDHRKTRKIVMEAAPDKKVLNLFAYTGSFSVYAAAGGAKHVDTVDLSGNYIHWAEKNFELNNLKDSCFYFHTADTDEFLADAFRNKKKYDIIILDPPTFSNSRKMNGTFDIQRDYIPMITACLSILSRDGFIIFSTNYKKFHFDPGRIKGGRSKDITLSTIDLDFSKKRKPHRCWIIEKISRRRER